MARAKLTCFAEQRKNLAELPHFNRKIRWVKEVFDMSYLLRPSDGCSKMAKVYQRSRSRQQLTDKGTEYIGLRDVGDRLTDRVV